MRIQKVIEQFGYKPREVKLYLSALTLGECTVSELSRAINLPRTSTQLILNKLRCDGLMDFYIKKRYKYWTAEKPEKFLLHLKEKEIAFETIFSRLKKIQHHENKKPSVKVFYDIKEIKLIFQDILDTKHNISAIIPWVLWINLLGKEYVYDFIELRVKHFLRVRLLTSKTKETLKLKRHDGQALRYTCFLPPRCTITDAILMYGDNVAIISLNEKYPIGILITDAGINNTVKLLFEEIWDQCMK